MLILASIASFFAIYPPFPASLYEPGPVRSVLLCGLLTREIKLRPQRKVIACAAIDHVS